MQQFPIEVNQTFPWRINFQRDPNISENPSSKLAANLDDALRNDKPYDMPVFGTRSLEFFEESAVLRKLCRLAEPFLGQ